MPLDHIKGEELEGFDPVFRVQKASKYAEQTRLTTEVEETTGTKFKRKVMVSRPIWQVAERYAMEAFMVAGANPGPLPYDCIAQEYPRTDVVCFIFNATIKGEEHYVTAPFKLSKAQIADLTLRNLWQPFAMNS